MMSILTTAGKILQWAVGAGPVDEAPVPIAVQTAVDVHETNKDEHTRSDAGREKQAVSPTVETGVSTIETSQGLWGKKGRWLIIIGICLVMIIYEIDNSTVYIYRNYAVSDFNSLSQLAALTTAGTIVFAVVKPPIAKLANVIGRGPTYTITISFYILSYVLMAASRNFATYSAGSVLYSVGQSGTNLLNDIVIADITTARWRAFAIGLSFWPFLITPWTAALIVERVTSPDGIGWRWGIGMLAVMMPFCASFIITTLLYYQGKAKKKGLAPRTKISLYEFCSQIDLGGVLLFSGGLALLLLPLTLAATTPSQWRTPWVDGLLAAGAVLLISLPFYEHYLSKNPVVPPRYFTNRTIGMCMLLIAMDNVGFSATHTYIYAWVTVAKGLGARDATFFTFVYGVTQCLVAILAGVAMIRTRRYKWICVLGSAVRLIGYGVMLRLRGQENSNAEIFIVQLIQGLGSGMVSTTLLVPAQVVLPHREMPQVTALVICFSFVGSSVGSCIAGAIYTNTLQPALWRYLGSGTTAETVAGLANSITGVVPEWGTSERVAVSYAFSEVMKYMTYAAVAPSVVALLGSVFLSNHELPDRNNLVEE